MCDDSAKMGERNMTTEEKMEAEMIQRQDKSIEAIRARNTGGRHKPTMCDVDDIQVLLDELDAPVFAGVQVIVIVDCSDGNDSVGDMWKETRIFDEDDTLASVMEWASKKKGQNITITKAD